MSRPRSGDTIDGFVVGECLHAGAMAYLHAVRAADGSDPGFPMLMKLPRMTPGDGAENIVSFEVEHQMLQVLAGPHVPRFVAAGDLDRLPYLVMEQVPGQTLAARMEGRLPLAIDEITRLGQAVATALHSLHLQNACHLDLKPANVLLRPDGSAVLIDFGLSCHAHYPDLLAEELRPAVGSPAWMAPEQVVGVRGDARSDLFALGVMLYEMATGELPFGSPGTQGGLRQRLWMDPRPPRALRPELPEALQELILRCLAPEAAARPPSAAHLAFDLGHLRDVRVSELGRRTRPTGFWPHLRRWLGAAGRQYAPSPLPSVQVAEVPILMVAVPHHDVSDATLYSLREAVARSLGLRPGARLACVTVISPSASSSTEAARSETALHRQHLARLRRWAEPLNQADHQTSFHVLESTDVADALLRYAEGNHVSMIILGAATHGLALQRLLATVPIRVAMHAPCTVILVKQSLPFDQLGHAAS
jgi:serine/threonine protein kinase